MYGYQKPGATQTTNIKNNDLIKEFLLRGEAVDILALPDHGLLHYGTFHINLAAGLEDSLVSVLNPEWNRTGTGKNEREDELVYEENQLSIARSDRPIYKLTLYETYYNHGFFNVTVDFDRYFGNDREEIVMHLGDTENIISGTINRTANTNGTARIMGRNNLTEWFQSNFNVYDTVSIEILSQNSVKMGKSSEH